MKSRNGWFIALYLVTIFIVCIGTPPQMRMFDYPTLAFASRDSSRADTTVLKINSTFLLRKGSKIIPDTTVGLSRSVGIPTARVEVHADTLTATVLVPSAGSVDSNSISNGGVSNADLRGDAVDSTKIRDTSIGTADLQTDAVDSTKIRAAGIGNADLQVNIIDSTHVRPATISNADLRNDAVDSTKTRDASISGPDLAPVLSGARTIHGVQSFSSSVGMGVTTPLSTLSLYRAPSATPGEMAFGISYTTVNDDLWGFRLSPTTYNLNLDYLKTAASYTPVLTITRASGSIAPGSDKTQNFGSLAAAWDSVIADDLINVADMPFFDDRDDVASIKKIRKSGEVDSLSGYKIVADSTLPKEIMVLYQKAGTHKEIVNGDTVLVPHAKGDYVKNLQGKGFYAVRNAFGLLFGAVKQLDSDRSNLSAWVLALQDSLRIERARIDAILPRLHALDGQ